jgi:hypothetical protein
MTFDVKILPPRETISQPFYGIYLLDTSGSMGEHDKIKSAKESLIEQVKTLPEGTIFSLITFGPAKVLIENQVINTETRQEFIRVIGKLSIGGTTPMLKALDKAMVLLKNYSGNLRTKKLTLISDGQPDGGCSDKDPEEVNFKKFMKFTQIALEYKASIDTVGALYGHNVLLLYELARRSTGKYIFANDEQELKEKMTIASMQVTQVLYAQPFLIITPLLGTCVVKDAVQFKPTVIRMPFEIIGKTWKNFLRSFETGDTYEFIFKLEYQLQPEMIESDELLEILDFYFEFGDPSLSCNKQISIQLSDDPANYRMNQQILKQYSQVFGQTEEISDATRKGDAEATQKIQGDETRKLKDS